jgi:hypothetical protein
MGSSANTPHPAIADGRRARHSRARDERVDAAIAQLYRRQCTIGTGNANPVAINPDPRSEYTTRLTVRRATVAQHERTDLRVAQARLETLVLFGLTVWLVMGGAAVSPWWLAGPAGVFLVLVIVHDRVIKTKQRAIRAVTFYEDGLARIEDRWMGRGQSTEILAGDAHLYAADLDLFGKGSLFELLCTARTRSGEETLARWLTGATSRADILLRQRAVDELRPLIDLREDLAILGPDIRSSVHPDTLSRWGRAAATLAAPWIRPVASVLATILIVSAVAAWFPGTAPIWRTAFFGGAAAAGLYALLLRGRVQLVLAAVQGPKRDLELLATLLARLEREAFHADRLVDLRSRLMTGGLPPSRQIARLVRLVDLLTLKQSDVVIALGLFFVKQIVFAPFSFMLWSTHIACVVDAWRQRCGPKIDEWLSVIGEFEALCALAGYAYEHPADPFPEIVGDGPVFDGDALGHPLIPADRCVANSVHLGRDQPLLVVSGSNMSGKSTLLRTVGVNTVLALAGAPVRAARLSVSPLAIGATLRIQDSLQAGTSRFYAEIQRFRLIMDLTSGDRPVLFLLDEILHGTNSHDRAIGAEAIVRGLIGRGAIGLVTTHDLALAAVADALAPRAANVHFADELRDGRMVFDYRMRAGVVHKSNALELMRAIGLRVLDGPAPSS